MCLKKVSFMPQNVSGKRSVFVTGSYKSPADVPIWVDSLLCDSPIHTSDFFGIFFQMSFPIFCFTVWNLYPTL